MNVAEEILVKLNLAGVSEYTAGMDAAAASTKKFGDTVGVTNARMKDATAKSQFLGDQLAFSMRRFTFYGTLAFLGIGAGLAKMGLDFNETMQNASVAFRGFLPGPKAVKAELQDLYLMTARLPFQFPDVVLAARRLLAFTGNAKETNQVIQDLLNSLSAFGIVSGAALSRASLAMAHMFSLGRLTGQMLQQFARDNIPLQKALEDAYHQTGLQIKSEVAAGLISATQAAAALNEEMLKPGFRNAAQNLALGTFSGAWSTFKDFLRMTAGTAELPLFGSIAGALERVDNSMIKMTGHATDMKLSMTDLAKAIDSALTPGTHLLLSLWVLFSNTLKTVYEIIGGLVLILVTVAGIFTGIASVLGVNIPLFKMLGIMVGILTAALIANEAITLAVAAAKSIEGAVRFILTGKLTAETSETAANTAAVIENTAALTAKATATDSVAAATAAYNDIMFASTQEQLVQSGALDTATASTVALAAAQENLMIQDWLQIAAAQENTIALGEEAVAADAATSSIVLLDLATGNWINVGLVAAGTLIVLYMRWKAFHNAIKDTYDWLKKNWKTLLEDLGASDLVILIQDLITVAKLIGYVFQNADKWIKDVGRDLRPVMKILDPILGGIHRVTHATHAVGHAASAAGFTIPGIGRLSLETVLRNIPGFGGFFQEGGIVGGPVGSPSLIMAHGGETVVPVSGISNGDWGTQPIIVQLVVDRKVLAQAVARAKQDYAARR